MTNTIETESVIAQTERYVQETLQADSSGHDWWHIHRVRNLAVRLAKEEGADPIVVELAALLHDIADWKFHDGDTTIGATKAYAWLQTLGVESAISDKVAHVISTVSYKGAGVPSEADTLEAKIVQDADRLDAIGAIGIARTFAYGGHFNRSMYEPDEKPVMHASFDEYKKSKGHTINHFYEKLLLLKERLNTPAARKIAEHRHKYMEDFLSEFFQEWNGAL